MDFQGFQRQQRLRMFPSCSEFQRLCLLLIVWVGAKHRYMQDLLMFDNDHGSFAEGGSEKEKVMCRLKALNNGTWDKFQSCCYFCDVNLAEKHK